jgi:putative FmdB family regulatory protein
MPLYEYECLKCGKRTERLQRYEDAPLAACPQCGGEVKKLFSAPAVQFKGSGWYVTDYAGKKGDSGSNSEKSEKAEKSESKGDGGGGSDKPAEAAKPAEAKASKSSSD